MSILRLISDMRARLFTALAVFLTQPVERYSPATTTDPERYRQCFVAAMSAYDDAARVRPLLGGPRTSIQWDHVRALLMRLDQRRGPVLPR